MDLIGGFILGPFKRDKNVEQRLVYVAIVHKDIGFNYFDFEKYSTVLVAYLNSEPVTRSYLTPLTETYWSTLVNSIFKLICDKMDMIRKMEKERDSGGIVIIFLRRDRTLLQ